MKAGLKCLKNGGEGSNNWKYLRDVPSSPSKIGLVGFSWYNFEKYDLKVFVL